MTAREHGQATVEIVALVPVVVAVAFGIAAVLAAGRAAAAAEAAAEAAAVAIIQGADGASAARRSLADDPPGRTTVRVRGGRVRVIVRPPIPLFARALAATAEADAGRAAPDVHPLLPIRGGDGAASAPQEPRT